MKNSSRARHDEPHDKPHDEPHDGTYGVSSDSSSEEMRRVREQLSARLRTRGVNVFGADSADDLGTMLEAVEEFENRVEAKGGDLMMDEAPIGKRSDPDNPAFVLPRRHDRESAHAFIARIRGTTSSLYR